MQIGPFSLPDNFELPKRERFALVDDGGIVRNIILLVPGAPYEPPAGLGFVLCGDDVAIGDRHLGHGEFMKPEAPVALATWADVNAAMQWRIDAVASLAVRVAMIEQAVAHCAKRDMVAAWARWIEDMHGARVPLVGRDVRTIHDDENWPSISESLAAWAAGYA